MNKTLHLGALKLKVARYLDEAYAGGITPPRPTEVISEALAQVVLDLHDSARDLETCDKVDTCTAQAVVLRHLADWLAELAREVAEEKAQ